MNRIGCCVAMAVLLAAGNLEASVTIASSAHQTRAYDGNEGVNYDQWCYATSIPLDVAMVAFANDGDLLEPTAAYSSLTRLETTQPGATRSETLFDYSCFHHRATSTTNHGSEAYGQGQDVFSVSEVTTVVLNSSCLVLTGVGTGWVSYHVGLLEDSNVLFEATEQRADAIGETFELATNLTEVLRPGHTYTFFYDARLWCGVPDGEMDVEAITWSRTTLSFVPEPTALIVWSLLGAVAAAIGWRRRKTAA